MKPLSENPKLFLKVAISVGLLLATLAISLNYHMTRVKVSAVLTAANTIGFHTCLEGDLYSVRKYLKIPEGVNLNQLYERADIILIEYFYTRCIMDKSFGEEWDQWEMDQASIVLAYHMSDELFQDFYNSYFVQEGRTSFIDRFDFVTIYNVEAKYKEELVDINNIVWDRFSVLFNLFLFILIQGGVLTFAMLRIANEEVKQKAVNRDNNQNS